MSSDDDGKGIDRKQQLKKRVDDALKLMEKVEIPNGIAATLLSILQHSTVTAFEYR